MSAASISRARDARSRRERAWRSHTTAAIVSVEAAATTRYSWVLSTVRLIESNTNGPWKWVVPQIVRAKEIRIARVAPRGPKRRAAQIRAGNTM